MALIGCPVNVGQFGTTDKDLDRYKQAGEYALEAKMYRDDSLTIYNELKSDDIQEKIARAEDAANRAETAEIHVADMTATVEADFNIIDGWVKDMSITPYGFTAIGGETTITLPSNFTKVSSIYINGGRQEAGDDFSYNNNTHIVTFYSALQPGDRVSVLAGTVYEQTSTVAQTLQGLGGADYVKTGDGKSVQQKLDEGMTYLTPEMFGAVDTKPDNASSFNLLFAKALITKQPVKIEKIFPVSTLTLNGFNFSISGSGGLSFTDPAGFILDGANKGVISGISLVFSGIGSTGITVKNSDKVSINNTTISNHGRNGGVYVLNSSNIDIHKNTFLSAASDNAFGSSTTADVNIWGTNSKCSITDNKFISGGGYAVQIRSHSLGDVSTNHIISRNIIDGYNSYGINCYRNKQTLTDTQVLNNIIVSDNIITNISGNRPSDPANPTVLIFGTGIYMQGAEMSTVVNNTISNVCIKSNNDLLAPAGIGVTNIGDINISNNTITQSGMYGIKVNDSVGLGDVYGRVIVSGNIIDTVGTDGIMVQDRNNAVITNNSIKTTGRDGIKVNTSPSSTTKLTTVDKTVSMNSLRDITGIGVYLEYSNTFTIENNNITKCAQGVVFQYSAYGRVSGNTVDTAVTRGFYAHVTNTVSGSIIFTENKCFNSTIQISVEHPIDYYNNPQITPVGTYANAREITADLPDVTGCDILNLKPTTAMNLTGFVGGKIGQRVTIWVNNTLVTLIQSGSFILAGLKNRNPGYNSVITFVKTKAGWAEMAQGTYPVVYINPASGSSITVSDYTGGVYIQGSSPTATLNITLPATPVDDQSCTICSQSGVTTLTLNANTGQSIYPTSTPTSLSPGTSIQYRFRAAGSAWFRYQ